VLINRKTETHIETLTAGGWDVYMCRARCPVL
jgi:hypothetical protein